ncbi:MAG: bifunctional diaminohydroxyphosphoribosylaminopyrimidine deaminase/5-amino-6-(5-phosphoribosylamino)uracil reductase RibD [Armatimonadota bacterium]
MAITADDIRYLRRALTLARRAHGSTSPNPMVGAVIARDGVIVGEGYHARAGEAHAEINALQAAGARARGATLYLTLEPCSHYGKTPPCADVVAHSGVRRVVFSSLDPNPLVAGQGLARLQAAGLPVDYGALAAQEEQLNEAWRYWMATRRPFVLVKLACSLDGKIATRTGESQWITGEAARRDVHRLRATQDAILTTAATVLADNPALTARLPGARDPRRVIIDAGLRTAPEARVYAPASSPPLLVTAMWDAARLAPFQARGVEVLLLPAAPGGLDLPALMAALGEREIVSLLVEAGGRFAAALFQAGLVHKLRLYLAPMLIGGREALPLLGGEGIARLEEAPRLVQTTWRRIGEDFRLEGRVAQP